MFVKARTLSLSLSAAALVACGGAQTPSPELFEQLSVAPSSVYQGELDTSKLTPASSVEGELDLSSLGRELKLAEGGETLTLLPPSPCAPLIPAKRVKQDYRDRLDEVFDEHLLTSKTSKMSAIKLPKLGYSLPVKGDAPPYALASAYVGLDRVLEFVKLEELKDFERCCVLTGTCGPQMVSKLYEVKRDLHLMSRQDKALNATLLAFEERQGERLNASKRAELARLVYQAQAKLKPSNASTAISHIEYRPLPKPASAPISAVSLTVTPSKKIRCKKKRAKQASAVEFTIKLEGVKGAEALLGYEINTSNKWVDLSLVKHNPRVRVGTGKIGCVPGEEAFTNYEHTCPTELMLMAFPPACEEVKAKGAGDFSWQLEAAVYAPGNPEIARHKAKSAAVITTVHSR